MTAIDLLVLRCPDLAATRAFYETVGLTFIEEQHGTGPEHLAAQLGPLVLELYPATPSQPADRGLRIGVSVDDVDAVTQRLVAQGHDKRAQPGPTSFLDPDGRVVALSSAKPTFVRRDQAPT